MTTAASFPSYHTCLAQERVWANSLLDRSFVPKFASLDGANLPMKKVTKDGGSVEVEGSEGMTSLTITITGTFQDKRTTVVITKDSTGKRESETVQDKTTYANGSNDYLEGSKVRQCQTDCTIL